jgi:hypothetical protein
VHQKRMGGESAKQVATTGLSEPERGSRPFDASTGRERAPRGDEKRRDAPLRLVPTRANTQPAFGRYLAVPGTEVAVSTDRQTRIA